MGNLNGNYTWKGKHGNLTFEELLNMIYVHDYKDLKYDNETIIFLMPYGFCLKFNKTTTQKIIYWSVKKSVFMLTDPAKVNSFKTNEMENSRIQFGPTTDGLFDISAYEIQYSLHDSRIQDGKTCTDYARLKSSYEECILTVLKARLLKYYNCLPPWFPKPSDQTCEKDKEIKVEQENQGSILEYSKDRINYDMNELILGRELEMLKVCLPPCLKMDVKMIKASHR